jgi:hypothetical protein
MSEARIDEHVAILSQNTTGFFKKEWNVEMMYGIEGEYGIQAIVGERQDPRRTSDHPELC